MKRQSKQLIPVVASAAARDKGKAKAAASAVPKLTPGGVAAAGAPLGARGKGGSDGSKRAEDAGECTSLGACCLQLTQAFT